MLIRIFVFSSVLFFIENAAAGYNSNSNIFFFDKKKVDYHLLGVRYTYPSTFFSASENLPQPLNKTVLILGGGPGFSSWNLEPIQQQIASWGYTVVLMDMAGIGENKHIASNKPVSTWIAQIKALKKHLNLQQPMMLVGHSWGALMAKLYLRDHPEDVDKVVLLNPVDPEKKAMQNLTAEIDLRNRAEQQFEWDNEQAWEQKTQVQANEVERITLRQIQQVLPTYFFNYEMGQKYAQQFTIADFNIDLNILAWKEYDANPVQYEQIKNKGTDFYFLECKQDYLMPYNLQAISAGLDLKKSVLLDGCGHFPWIEKPQDFYNHLKQFFKGRLSSMNVNRFSPKKLKQSKWTAINPVNKEKHFMVVDVEWDEEKTQVLSCDLQAVLSKKTYTLEPYELKDANNWLQGWK